MRGLVRLAVLLGLVACSRAQVAPPQPAAGEGWRLAQPAPLEAYGWAQPQAKVLPTGDLEWQPEPYRFTAVGETRYIDYAAGNDAAAGTRAAPWQHHPWDPAASGQARAASGITTYVFRCGVVYRGELRPTAGGSAERPVRLTSDPTWGTGEAVLAGSERVTGWQRGADLATLPDREQVWWVDLPWLPRNAWLVAPDGAVTRLNLARTPNWRVSNYDDVKSEWWTWDNPGKPFDNYINDAKGTKLNLGIDTQHLTQPAEYYQDAIVWTEFGWVMGSPYPTRVEVVDPAQKGLGFGGKWGGAGDYKIVRHMRYCLEDKPQYLDEPGEFWCAQRGQGGRLYLRLPGDADPNQAQVEVARRLTMIDARALDHVVVSGLTFRFTNVVWDLTAGPWGGPDVEPGCLRLNGSGSDLQVDHCTFEHVHKAVRLKAAGGPTAAIDDVRITDNIVRETDHGAFDVADGGEWGVTTEVARVRRVSILRNRIDHIGRRPQRYGHGHAISVQYAEDLEVAGNLGDKLWGSGIFVFGGKPSGSLTDRPFSRILIHHNKITDPLLNTNDWGGIETWQGGPAYVYNNISGNPGGYWNYGHRLNPTKPANARFGHAYYLDGAFKNYHFNNIAWGKSSDPLSPLGNTAAFQEIHSYQNTFFNNTVYRFVIGSRRQAPAAGRNKFLGNVWQDIGQMVFRHADPRTAPREGNAADAGAAKEVFDYGSNAYANNLFQQVAEYGLFEAAGNSQPTFAAFAAALAARGSLGPWLGRELPMAPLPRAAELDFRPAPGGPTRDAGVRTFVPWSLAATVGEWHFLVPGDGGRSVLDEHWYLTPYHIGRDDYYQRPSYPLDAVGGEFVAGPLESWTKGALALDGRQYAVARHAALSKPYGVPTMITTGQWAEVTAPQNLAVGRPATLEVKLLQPFEGQRLHVDLHFSKAGGGFGGVNVWGGTGQPVRGAGPYRFNITPVDKPGLENFVVTVFVSREGTWESRTQTGQVTVPRGAVTANRTTGLGGQPTRGTRDISGEELQSPQIHNSSLLLEVCFRAEPGGGEAVLVAKLGGRGYSLTLNAAGQAVWSVQGGPTWAVTGRTNLADGAWHQVLAECDRAARRLTLYVDGQADGQAAGPAADVSLAGDGDLHLGGSPSGRGLRGALEFARIARSSLATSQTTAAELYAWEFNGPMYRDFTGAAARGAGRDAGALEGD
ncbi:MAG: hypothetical protein IT204_02535 [Fimbriimonadaceae bacterium]|nr:hypothetical protein [Fimbriimonadaceae bacterium]